MEIKWEGEDKVTDRRSKEIMEWKRKKWRTMKTEGENSKEGGRTARNE